ncbi:MAG: hypothetical protein KME42_19300 [Tildeniella nuda ZEHNDER 1965/U140]|nr:hypothetical protein [Tildeniella nuda ZEHNDER 1965/U140]
MQKLFYAETAIVTTGFLRSIDAAQVLREVFAARLAEKRRSQNPSTAL